MDQSFLVRTSPIESYLADLASGAPTPGGGAAAALTLAQSCALFSMALKISFKNPDLTLPADPRIEGAPRQVREVLDSLEQHRDRFLCLGQEDIKIFDSLMMAYRMPRTNEHEEDARRSQLALQTGQALDVCFRMAQWGLETTFWGRYGVYLAKQSIISDSAIATELLVAGVTCSLINARINLQGIRDRELTQKKYLEITDLENTLEEQTRPLRNHCRQILTATS